VGTDGYEVRGWTRVVVTWQAARTVVRMVLTVIVGHSRFEMSCNMGSHKTITRLPLLHIDPLAVPVCDAPGRLLLGKMRTVAKQVEQSFDRRGSMQMHENEQPMGASNENGLVRWHDIDSAS